MSAADFAWPAKVAVVGGGRMGSGIAHAFLSVGCDVALVEVDDAAAEAARQRVQRIVDRTAARAGAASDAAALASSTGRLVVGVDPGLVDGAFLVVESIVEDIAAKRRLLQDLERWTTQAVLIATNTSSISIDELAVGLAHPDKFLGLHFFNPVPSSELVEVVVGSATAATVVEQAVDVVRRLGKTAVTVRDSPGFVSSRLGVALALEAIRMVQDGVAQPAEIDQIMTLGYRHATGPLRLTDIVGLDVRLAIAEYLARKLGPRFEPPALLRDKVARGELGRKAGRGFYDWPSDGAGDPR
ncbi:MAG: 3-hydroxyacyl-CoA dehydrogenase family protein [Acidothermus sp.]|nr:3-hydroxyacyl-CoA dehydrogenase family protein [Acidothermus sp.]